MAVGSIGGLASGLDTAGIIDALMAVESIQQNTLKTRKSASEGFLKNIQDINSKIASLTTKAADLAKASAWNPLKASASSDKVSVTATPSANIGTVTFKVNSLAESHQLTFNSTAAKTDLVTNGPTTVRLTMSDGTTKDIDTGDGTLTGLVDALNASTTGVRASTVKLNDGTFRLSVTSTKTGSDSNFTLTNTDGSAILGGATVRAGADASLTVGADTVTSKSNTFNGTVNGLNITLTKGVPLGEDITVTTTGDVDTARKQAKDLVDGLNAALDAFDALATKSRTKGNSDAYDSTLRDARSRLLKSVVGTTADLASLGIETDRYGNVKLDATKFDAAFNANPTAVAEKFVADPTGAKNGFAERLRSVGSALSDRFSGTITRSIENRQSGISKLGSDISAWDVRLSRRRTALEKQFTGLEVALAGIANQGNYLAGAINSLPSYSNN